MATQHAEPVWTTGPDPTSRPAPRASGRTRRAATTVPRVLVLVSSLAIVSLLAAAAIPVPSSGAQSSPPAQHRPAADAPATRGCRPAPPPTPTPPPTPSPSPAPSVSPSPSPSPTPVPTPKPTPTPYIPPGIDVSVWNGRLDYAPIAAAGMRFVFIKATQGTSLVDRRFAGNVSRARAEGLLAGAYHFFDYTQDGVAQADLLVDAAATQGMLTDAMPLTVDVECWNDYGWSVWAEVVPRLRAMVDRIYERTGRMPIIYTSRHMWSQVTGGDLTFSDLPLWVACWRCDAPLKPAGWTGWRFWQIRPYRFRVIGKTLDGNVFNGTDASLETWRGDPVLINGGSRVTGDRLVRVDLSAFDGIDVRTSDDSSDWSGWAPWTATVEHRLTAGDGDREVRVQVRDVSGIEGPVLADHILLDQTGPELGPPVLTLRSGQLGSALTVPVGVTWTATDELAGVESSSLVHDCGAGLGGELAAGGAKARTGRAGPPRRRVAVSGDEPPVVEGVVGEGACHLSVRGVDTVGNRREPGAPVTVDLTVIDQAALVPAPGSRWTTATQQSAVSGTVVRTRSTGARLRFRVQAEAVGIVATTGPTRGQLRIVLDGVVVGIVDLYAPGLTPRSLVAVVALPDAAPHTLRLVALGTRNPLSTGKRVDLDAVVTTSAVAPDPSVAPSAAPD